MAMKMVLSVTAANPPAKYNVGCEVLVRRFSAKSKMKHGKGLARKMSRVVNGTIIDANASSHRYKVRYLLNGKFEECWYPVGDITSLTREDEKNRKSKVSNYTLPSLYRSMLLFTIRS